MEAPEMAEARKIPVGTDLMEYFGLKKDLKELQALSARGKMRSSFSHLIADIPSEETPINPRCAAGLLVDVALQPVAENEKTFEPFPDRLLRLALVLQEDKERIPQPAWLSVDQPQADEDKKRKKNKKKKKRRRKRSGAHGDDADESDRRKHKKRKKDQVDSEGPGADTDADNVVTDAT